MRKSFFGVLCFLQTAAAVAGLDGGVVMHGCSPPVNSSLEMEGGRAGSRQRQLMEARADLRQTGKRGRKRGEPSPNPGIPHKSGP